MMAVARFRVATWPKALTGSTVGLGLCAASVGLAIAKAPDTNRLIIGLGYLGVLALIAAHDARTQKAPNRLIYPALAAAILASLTLGSTDALEAVFGGVLSFAVLLGLAVAGRGAIGAGDVKVGALCGIALGLHGAVPMLLVTFIAGGVTAALLLLLGIRKRPDTIAFTPFLVAATLVCMAYFRLYLWG
jgi:prepilin signal peptidase PulO-like enzyme (type II secretory pathway)